MSLNYQRPEAAATKNSRRGGWRALKRAVQERILHPLSRRRLEDEFKPGDRIKVMAKNDVLVFAKK